jgi:hypothetical protein
MTSTSTGPRTLLNNEINGTGAAHLRYAAVVEAMDVARGAGVKVIGWP